MPRIRYLKPEFFTDEDLAELPFQTRLMYAGLWCYADKAGRLEERPKYLKAMIFPYDSMDINKQLDLLSKPKNDNGSPFIVRYTIDDRPYIQILSWEKHQKPHHTEAESKFPPAPPLKREVKGNGELKQLNPSARLSNGVVTVKEPLTGIPYLKIISYLNKKTGKNFSYKTSSYQKLIRARWNDGKKLTDFEKVIDIKCSKWMTDPKMVDYCRPETLFGTKMDSYLNEADFIPTDEADRIIYELKKEREKK